MLVLSVSQLLEMSVDSVPEAFKGKVTKVIKPVSGGEGEKAWKMQKVIISDGAKEIQCVFDKRPDISRSVEGQEMHVIAARGQRGLTGTKRREYAPANAAVVQQVWIYDSADVTFNGAAAPAASSAPPARESQPPASNPPPAAKPANGHQNGSSQPPPKKPAENDLPVPGSLDAKLAEIEGFNTALGKSTSALLRCYDAAFSLVAKVDKKYAAAGGFKATPSDIKEIASTLLIQTCWNQKTASIPDFPVKEFEYYLEKEKARAAHTDTKPPETVRQGAPFE